MKRFLVFSGDQYYPSGGWGDFQGSFDTREEAKSHLLSVSLDWWQIVDSHTQDVEGGARL